MTQSVTDETPIPDTSWRRHTDPPSLWIAVTTISLTLHLLFFWLLRSYSYNFLSRQNSSNPIPVEFVEISSQPKPPSKAKPVLFKKPSAISSPKLASQGNLTPKSTSNVEDSNAFAPKGSTPRGSRAFTNPTSPKSSEPQVKKTTQQSLKKQVTEQKQPQPNPKPIATSQPTRQPELFIAKTPEPPLQPTRQPEPFIAKTPEPPLQPTPEDTPQAQQPQPTPEQTQSEPPLQPTPEAQQPQPTPEQTTLADNPDTQNQSLQNQVPNPQNNTTDSTRPDSSPETGEQAKLFNESTESPGTLPRQPDEQVIVGQETPLPNLAPLVTPQQSPLDEPKVTGVALATWEIDTNALKKDRPDNPPQIAGDIKEQELDSLALNTELSDQPIEFRVLLLIKSDGNFYDVFLDPEQKIPEPQATQYKKYAEKIFKSQKFIPASSNNGNKPDLGQLVVKITIQRKFPKS